MGTPGASFFLKHTHMGFFLLCTWTKIILNNDNRGLREKASFNWQHLNTVYASPRSLKNESLSNYVPFQGSCVEVWGTCGYHVCATIFPSNLMLASYVCKKFRWQTFSSISFYSAGNISVFDLFIPIREISSWFKIIPRIVHHFLLPWNNTMMLLFTLVMDYHCSR